MSHPINNISVIIPALIIHHSFTLSLKAQNLPFQQILPILDIFYLLYCLMIMGHKLKSAIGFISNQQCR